MSNNYINTLNYEMCVLRHCEEPVLGRRSNLKLILIEIAELVLSAKRRILFIPRNARYKKKSRTRVWIMENKTVFLSRLFFNLRYFYDMIIKLKLKDYFFLINDNLLINKY